MTYKTSTSDLKHLLQHVGKEIKEVDNIKQYTEEKMWERLDKLIPLLRKAKIRPNMHVRYLTENKITIDDCGKRTHIEWLLGQALFMILQEEKLGMNHLIYFIDDLKLEQ